MTEEDPQVRLARLEERDKADRHALDEMHAWMAEIAADLKTIRSRLDLLDGQQSHRAYQLQWAVAIGALATALMSLLRPWR